MIRAPLPMTATPSEAAPRANMPVERVTWRTSSGRPKNFPKTGVMPSIKPRTIDPPQPAMFREKVFEMRAKVSGSSFSPRRCSAMASGKR